MYVAGVEVGSIYSVLKNRGCTVEDVREFIQDIENKIWDLKVKIEPTNVEIKSFKPKNDEWLSKILVYKPLQIDHPMSRNHDLAVIEMIKKVRGFQRRRIEDSKAFFLTSDLGLARFNFLEMGHKEKATICEVIPDRLLTTILWLKNPALTKNVPLKSVIALHSREMFINREIWFRFYANIRRLMEEGKIGDKDISMLFYDHHIEDVLKELDESDIDKITPKFILKEITNVTKAINGETRRKFEEQRKMFEEKLAGKEIEKDKELAAKLTKIKQNLEKSSRKEARKQINILAWVIVGIIAVALVSIVPLIMRKWQIIEPIVWISTFITVVLDVLFGWRKFPQVLKNYIETRLFNKIYRVKLNELGSDTFGKVEIN